MKKTAVILVLVLCLSLLAGCAEKGGIELQSTVSEAAVTLLTGAQADKDISEDTKYGAAIIAVTPEELEQAGFRLGDSVEIEFENGLIIADVPYYNGYYVKNGEPVLVAYPGFNDVRITYNNSGIWESAGLEDGMTVTLRLIESGRYSAIQDSLGQVYSFEYDDYDSSVEFCNFRALSGGGLKENFLYRGASPVDNSRSRAPYTDELLAEYGIAFVVDLADSEEDLEGYMAAADFNSPYFAELYAQGSVALLDMGSAYQSAVYQQKLVSGLRAMLSAEGPVYIHCMEGKDRTGFVCLLLEALAGASLDELRADYMKTYDNYYSVNESETPEKYSAISELYFDAFIEYLHGSAEDADFVQDAANYLIEGGMSATEVMELRDFITK